jgi:uncharacterized protein (DUF2147 family)
MSHTKTLLLAAAFLPAPAAALEGSLWRTATGTGIVRMEACGAQLCGVLARVMPPAGQPGVDANNPDPALRTRTLTGVRILTGFTRRADGTYGGGRIYNPEDGRTYASNLRRRPDGRLEVKGCVGPLCRTQTWTAAN